MIDARSADALVDAVISASPASSAPQQVGGVVQGRDADGTIWVLLDGATEPTPSRSTTVAVSPGDVVTATIGGGRVAIDGNKSRPATDDARAIEAKEAAKDAMEAATAAAAEATRAMVGIESAEADAAAAMSASSAARIAADQAESIAKATGQHFWHNSSDASTHGGVGVHVTDQTQEDWDDAVADGFSDASANKPYHNVLINSLGILLRSALSNLVSITRSAISFFDGSGNNAANITASFGASSAQIGKTSSKHVTIDSNGTSIYDGSTLCARYGSTIDLAPEQINGEVTIAKKSLSITGNATDNNYAGATMKTYRYRLNSSGQEVVSGEYEHPHASMELKSWSYKPVTGETENYGSSILIDTYANLGVDEASIQMSAGQNSVTGTSSSMQLYATNIEVNADALTLTSNGTLKLTKTTDASGTADNQPALMIGAESGQHLEFDGNEIMSKASGTTTGTLWINNDGGLVGVGSGGIRTTGKYMVRDEDVTAGTAPASTTYIQTVEVQASGGTVIGHEEYVCYDTGMIGHNFAAVRQSVNGTMTWYQARMMVDSVGTVSYYVPGAAAFRSAISAASDSHTHAAVKSNATSQITMESGRTLNSIYTAKAAGSVLTVMISFKPTSNLTSGTTYDVGTLASGLRPYGASFNASTGTSSVDDAWITTGGVVKYRPGANRASGTTLQVNATYVVA